jgi:hypothetical protein
MSILIEDYALIGDCETAGLAENSTYPISAVVSMGRRNTQPEPTSY